MDDVVKVLEDIISELEKFEWKEHQYENQDYFTRERYNYENEMLDSCICVVEKRLRSIKRERGIQTKSHRDAFFNE